MSKASFIGRMGINFFYKEYKFLKVWWQGALVVFCVWVLLLLIQGMVQKRNTRKRAIIIHIVCVLAAIVGLYFTYNDFRHSFNHRLLGERFHLGAYLFWIGWIIISLFYLVQKRAQPVAQATVFENKNSNNDF